MYFYQIVEGIFHLMIVVGSLWLLFTRRRLLPLYRTGLWLEIIWMDVRTFTPTRSSRCGRSVPGFPGLAVLMMALHHLTVLPDLVSAYLEWRAGEPKRKLT